MPEMLTTIRHSQPADIPKAIVEREARAAFATGVPPQGCPHPIHSTAGLHWLAIYNLCMPLPRHETTRHR